MHLRNAALVALLLVTIVNAGQAFAGAYIGADGANPSLVMHPSNYSAGGGNVTVGVCISPSSAVTTALEVPVQNVIRTMNAQEPTIGNLIFGNANNIPSGQIDAESVLLHEVGHCIGLAHPNLASESGLPSSQRDYTKSTLGNNGTYNLNDGADNVIGSGDDIRGDDVNLHWFRTLNNNPFTIAGTVDSSTYSRDLGLLPSGNFAANAARAVSSLLGLPSSEAVMQQGTGFDEAQRTLSPDDVATLAYARSGLDEVAGTADDSTTTLVYRGVTTSNCNVTVTVDSNTGFASCSVGFQFVGAGDHWRITTGTVRLNNQTNWFYNQVDNTPDPNEPPVLAAIGDQSVTENETLVISLSASDPDAGDVLMFSDVGLPEFCPLTDNGDRSGQIDCNPGPDDSGSYQVSVFVNDDGTPVGFDSEVFLIEVIDDVPDVDTDGDGVFDSADNCTLVANADQRDSNADGYGNVCDADLDGDCVTNAVDLGLLRTVFFTPDADADFNGDGIVNTIDLGVFKSLFFLPPGPSGVTSVCDPG